MRASRIYSIGEARRLAKRVLPPVVFDYVDGGADDEVTMRANTAAFEEVDLVPRLGIDVGSPELRTTVLGSELSMPILLAPCGLVRVMHPDAAGGVARAAARHGTISVLSTVAGTPLEEVAAEAAGPLWFQLYATNRAEAEGLVERAAVAGAGAIVVTLDTPVLGNRERDVRHRVAPPLRVSPHNAVHLGYQVLSRPAWVWRLARQGVRVRGSSHRRPAESAGERAAAGPTVGAVAMAASPFRWEDVEWLRAQWQGPLVVKGILSPEDARRAAGAGADGVIVSNHGGRQLDGAPATLRVLPAVVEAVGSETEVLMDGGVRRGAHVVAALALGARAVLVGRPYMYGLAVAGAAGVEQILSVLRGEMARTMALLGCPSVHDLDPSWLRQPNTAEGAEHPGSPMPPPGR
ncbi:MAG TPA: alpha-hydroxy acid oxidase [Acidimicrobiales bacterium]|nr:alpha-hydroxy acid oxidase [Acidimicrobiales bacterium]